MRARGANLLLLIHQRIGFVACWLLLAIVAMQGARAGERADETGRDLGCDQTLDRPCRGHTGDVDLVLHGVERAVRRQPPRLSGDCADDR